MSNEQYKRKQHFKLFQNVYLESIIKERYYYYKYGLFSQNYYLDEIILQINFELSELDILQDEIKKFIENPKDTINMYFLFDSFCPILKIYEMEGCVIDELQSQILGIVVPTDINL